MNTENKNIKQDIYRLFEEGKTETEAFEELSKAYSSNSASLKAISNWFTKFKLEEYIINEKKKRGRPSKITDDFLISLINENPGLNMKELAKLANTSGSNISIRLKEINSNRSNDNKIVLKQSTSKTERNHRKVVSNDPPIKLVNENPELNARQLTMLADVSTQTIYSKLNKTNADVQRVSYIKESTKNNVSKFTDEFIINLINENPGLNMTQLAKLANTTASTIATKLKKINSNGKDVNYIKKDTNGRPKKFTDEFLINLINENPELNITQLAKLANTTATTISNRLKQFNTNGKDISYIKKVTNSQAIKFTDEFLINLINESPELNIVQLAKLTNTSSSTISARLKKINSNGKDVNYVKKDTNGRPKKFTDEFLINLINENPELNMVQLAKLTNTTRGTISNRLKRINSNDKDVNYIKKDTNGRPKKFTDEFLINLINENPELNMIQLAKLANTTATTISNRLKQFNTNGKDISYIKKVTNSQAIKFTDEFLINLINESPELNIVQLAKLTNTSSSTVSTRLKKINSNGKDVNYVKKVANSRSKKFTDEFLINLINENPELNMVQLAKLTNTSSSTISARLMKINSNGERVNYIMKR